jgi:hypothetical protein
MELGTSNEEQPGALPRWGGSPEAGRGREVRSPERAAIRQPRATPWAKVARCFTAGMTLLLLIFAASAHADPTPKATAPVTVKAGVDRNQVTIGDHIRYTVEVSAAAQTEIIVPVYSGKLGDFVVSDFGELPTRQKNGRTITSRWYTLSIFETGDHLIPAPKVQYRTPGEDPRDAEGNEVLVGVTSLLAQEKNPADIRDIKPPEEVPFDWRPIGVGGAAVVVVGLLGWGLFYLLNRPRRQRALPPQPPHEVALAALNRLRVRRLIEEGKFEEYYVQLSAIVRRYLEDRFNLRAPEMTTEEFLSAVASDGRLIPPHRRLLAEFLSQADLVKFARHLPTLDDSEGAYNAARRFVEETRTASAPQNTGPQNSSPQNTRPQDTEVRDAAA